MRPIALPFLCWLSHLLAGCGGGSADKPDAALPDAADPGTPILIRTDQAAALVAFRDGLGGAWQAATRKSATELEAGVHGPYVVAIVCENLAIRDLTMWLLARTLDDDRTLTLNCDFQFPTQHAVTGHMVQLGSISIARTNGRSTFADWDFTLDAPTGTFDLIASSTDHIALRRAIEVKGDLVITPAVDLAQEGTLLVAAPLIVTNAAPAETITAGVSLDTTTTKLHGVYTGPSADVRIAPDSALIATDVQSASIRADDGARSRELTRPFRAGGDSVFTLPPPIGGAQFTIENGQLVASWTTLPPLDTLDIIASGLGGDPMFTRAHYVNVSPRFATATGLTRLVLDTEIPGFKPAWKLDFTGAYTRAMTTRKKSNDEVAISSLYEQINF